MPQVRIPLNKATCEAIVAVDACVLTAAALVRGTSCGEAYIKLIVVCARGGSWEHVLQLDRKVVETAHVYHVALSPDEQTAALVVRGDSHMVNAMTVDCDGQCTRHPQESYMCDMWFHNNRTIVCEKRHTQMLWNWKTGACVQFVAPQQKPSMRPTKRRDIIEWSLPNELMDTSLELATSVCDRLKLHVDGVRTFLDVWTQPAEAAEIFVVGRTWRLSDYYTAQERVGFQP
jgi:hypothetical protein